MKISKKAIYYFLEFIFLLIIDQLTKLWLLNNLSEPHKINNFLTLKIIRNRGISLGMLNFSNQFGFYLLTSAIAIIIFCLLIPYIYIRHKKFNITGEILILSGAVSNLIDRFNHSGVIDFILIHYGNWSLPIFNIADILIFLGIILIIVLDF